MKIPPWDEDEQFPGVDSPLGLALREKATCELSLDYALSAEELLPTGVEALDIAVLLQRAKRL